MVDLFSESRVMRADPNGVREAYEDWPRLAREGFRANVELPGAHVKKVYVLAMGGSASGGDIVSSWLSNRPGVEMAVFKGQIPTGDLGDAVVIVCSASGQTEETLSMLRTAVERRARLVSISGGGRLDEVSDEMGVPRIGIPKFMAPRYVFPFIFFSTLAVANKVLDLRCEDEAEDALKEMETERKHVCLQSSLQRNPAKALALRIREKVVAVYGTRVTRGVGIRFKNVLNENSKKHAHFDAIPDAFHNEIEAWEDPSAGFVPIFLRHTEETERDRVRGDEMVRILKNSGKGPLQIRGRGESSLAQLATMVYRLDLTSYYTAVSLGRDPFPTRFIDRLKRGS